MKSYKFIVSGRVQGVYYRKTICENAIIQNFKGYVKNLSNGDVEVVVSCDENNLNKFIDILQRGSNNSIVNHIEQSYIDEIFTKRFEIK